MVQLPYREMKYFYLTFTLFVILPAHGISDQVNNEVLCQIEIDTEIKDRCPQTKAATEMFFNYFNYRDQRIDRAQFYDLVEKYCGKMLGETQCVLENVLPIISNACNTSTHYDSVLVQAKYHNVFTQYFCANNQTRYMDTIEDDGVNCLFSRKFAECFYTNSLPAQAFTSAGICGLLNTNIYCEHNFDECVNQYIKTYRAELFRLLKQTFDC